MVAHYSSKPCDTGNCCCRGDLFVDDCFLRWTTNDTTYARVKKDGVVVASGLSGVIQYPANGEYVLEVVCTPNGNWTEADRETFTRRTDVECCDGNDGPSCLESLDSITEWTVTVTQVAGCSSSLNGTYILDSDDLAIDTATQKLWTYYEAVDPPVLCFTYGSTEWYRVSKRISVVLYDVGQSRCLLSVFAVAGYAALVGYTGGNNFISVANSQVPYCASSGSHSSTWTDVDATINTALTTPITIEWEGA